MLKRVMPILGLIYCATCQAQSTEEKELTKADSNQVESEAASTAASKTKAQTEEEKDAAILKDLLGDDDSSQKDTPTDDKKEKNKKKKEKSPFSSEIEFGFQSHQGNTDNLSLNARLEGTYTKGPFRYQGEFKAYAENEDGEEDERQISYQLQTDYKLSQRNYLYGNFKGIDSKYSSYFHDYTFSAGWGMQIYNTKKFELETELGPGYRYQDPNTDEIDDDDPIFPDVVKEAIIRGNLATKWKPMKTLELGLETTVVSGDSNTRIDTDLHVTTNMTKLIALKVGYTDQYLTKVPEGLHHSDSIVTVNILFALN